MGDLRFAIIGCGRIAQRHAEHMQAHGKIIAICDTNEERKNALAQKYGSRAYHSVDELVSAEKELDIISVCTPNGLHARQSIQCLEAGMNVLCEKPMALTTSDCRQMIEAAEKAKKYLFIVKQNRFNAPVAELKKIIEEGRLGKIVNVQLNCFWNRNDKYYETSEWKGKKELDGGTLFTQFSHFIDLLYWMIGDVKNIQSVTRNFLHRHNVEFDDTGVVALEFMNGALGTINYTVNSFEKNMEGSITVFGEKGTVKVGGQYLNVLEYQNIQDYKMQSLFEAKPANDYGFYQGSMSNHDKVYENVADVLKRGGQIATSGFEGLKTVEIIERIYTAAG